MVWAVIGSSFTALPLRMGPIDSRETSVTSYQTSVTSYQTSVTSYQTSVTSYQTSVTSYQTSVTSYQTTQILDLHRGGSIKLRRFFFFFTPVQSGPGALTACCKVGSATYFPGVKWLGCEVDHPPSSCAEVKNGWSCASAPLCACTGTLCLLL